MQELKPDILVVINIDETEDPEKWILDDPCFDLVFLNYSSDKNFYIDLKKYGRYGQGVNVNVFDFSYGNLGKWKNISAYMRNQKIFDKDRYKYFWFPDPDLEMDKEDIWNFLMYCKANKLNLCQPALTYNSKGSHRFLMKQGEGRREVTFVEVMCPFFSEQALIKNYWTFVLTHSGWGIDLVWGVENRCYVVDKYTIHHDRAPSFNSRKPNHWPPAEDELLRIETMFNVHKKEMRENNMRFKNGLAKT